MHRLVRERGWQRRTTQHGGLARGDLGNAGRNGAQRLRGGLTGPVQAPAEAHSARGRILLRASTERGATVVIDDVTFAASETAEAAPPSPAARVQSTPTATPIASPTPPPHAASAPTPEPADDAPAVVSEGVRRTTSNVTTAAQRRLRITEIVSDTGESGADGDFEWVEVMNTGGEVASLAGRLTTRPAYREHAAAVHARPGRRGRDRRAGREHSGWRPVDPPASRDWQQAGQRGRPRRLRRGCRGGR